MKDLTKALLKQFFPIASILLLLITSCNKQDDGLAPYVGSPRLSKIVIQDSTFKPKITWLGGYVSVVGINQGSHAALDSTLVFTVYKAGDDLHYPIKFGEVPAGAQELTTQYGGSRIDSLYEDSTYTFWILREAEWNQISSMHNKILVFDPTLSTSIQINGDTIRLSADSYYQSVNPINVYINIADLRVRGRLGTITVEATNVSNNPIIRFNVTQVEDTLISAMGIVEAGQFSSDAEIWSVLSVSDSAGQTLYGKANVISSPVVAGQNLSGTQVFVEYPEGGLQKNKSYYLWIANKFWDGEGRILSTNYYAYVTFNTK